MRVTVNGVPMYVAARGQGYPITFVHGFPLNHRIFDSQVRALSRTYRVLAPDLRGFGKTPFSGEEITIETYAQDIVGLLDALDIEQTVLAGLSMGGYIAFAMWRLAPERIRALVLLNTRAGADTEEGRRRRFETIEQVQKDGIEPLVQSMLPKLLSPVTLRGKRHVVHKLEDIMRSSTREGVIAALRAMAHRPDSQPLLEHITVPTLIVAGRDDAIVPVSEAESMALAIPNAQLQVVEQAGHLVTMERPRTTSRLIGEFLAGVL